MRISQDIIDKYGSHDFDVLALVGSHDETVSNMLAESGFNVLGIDLREYDKNLPPCNYNYLRWDFNDGRELE